MAAPGPIRIGLLWHSVRSGNLGVGALTVSNLALIREACEDVGLTPFFLVLGMRESGPVYVHGDDIAVRDIDTRFLLSPGGFWKSIATVDCVIDIGSGDSFADIYGFKRFGFLWATKLASLGRRRPLLLAPQTIGPFERRSSRRLAVSVMNRAQAVIARDPHSLEHARALGVRTRLLQSIDVAFALPYEPAPRGAGDKVRVGVNVSGLLFGRAAGNGSRFGLQIDYPALMRGLLADLSQRQDVEVKLITHVVSKDEASDDDAHVADLLAREFPGAERVPDFKSPGEAKGYISGLDLLIAARMHACIAAYSSGVPVVPIAYSRKFDGLFRGVLDYGHGIPVSGWSTKQALDYLMQAYGQRAQLGHDVADGLRRVDERLDVYRGELRRFLGRSAPGASK